MLNHGLTESFGQDMAPQIQQGFQPPAGSRGGRNWSYFKNLSGSMIRHSIHSCKFPQITGPLKIVTVRPFEKPSNPPSSPFSKGGKSGKNYSIEFPKALLPLKKGGREGFPARPFQSAKVLRLFDKKRCLYLFSRDEPGKDLQPEVN